MSGKQTDLSIEALEAKYNDITVLFDQAEELVATVESKFVQDQEQQLAIVEPLINEIGDAADVLSEEFVLIAESKKGKPNKASKSRIEAALRKVYVAISDYNLRVNKIAGKTNATLRNIADPIVAKIQRQVEQVVVIFMEFIQVSLHNIMNKAEAEALRVRDVRVAMMMHQHALSQQQ